MRGERESGKTRKEMRKKGPFCFSPFLSSGFLCFPPRQTSSVFSLIHCETPQPGCRSRVSSQLLSLEISPGPATRQYPSPNSKEITLGAASCRCGHGEKRTKEDALLGVSIFCQWRSLSATATGLLSFQNSVGRPKPTFLVDPLWFFSSRHSKQEQRAKTPPSSSRAGDETSHAFDAAAARKIFLLLSFQVEKNKTLTCALVAEQSRTSPARSGSTVALDRVRMPEG